MCEVLHVRHAGKQSNDRQIYIGRPSQWGNPFVNGRNGSRSDVIAQIPRMGRRSAQLMASLGELRGKNLICFYAPLACHGDVLIDLANAP